MALIRIVDWTYFKTLTITKQLGLTYTESDKDYSIYATEGSLIWVILLAKDSSADVTDFENNFKALSNKPSFLIGQFRNKCLNITGNTTVTVKSGNGVIRAIAINNDNTGGTIVAYDNTDASGTKIASIQLGTPSGGLLSSTGLRGPTTLQLVAEFATGLTIVTSGSSNNNITILYV